MKMIACTRIAVLFLLSLLIFSCDKESTSDYILVTVNLSTVVYQGEMGSNPMAGQPVTVTMVQPGGEPVDETKTTDAAGSVTLSATFKLYPDQSIETCVELTDLPGNYNCETLGWHGAEAGATVAGGERQYTWTVTLDLVYPVG